MTVPVAVQPQISVPTPEQEQAAKDAEARLQQLLAQGDINQANAVTAIYGDSGTGKSSLAATAAEYCWRRFHRTTDYIAADLGGFGNKLLRLIRLNIVRVYNPQNHIEPFETMEDLSLGAWPETILDPFTGFAAPDVPLIPAQRQEWIPYCPNNHAMPVVTHKASLQGYSRQCKSCNAVCSPTNWLRVEERTVRAAHHQHVGLRIFDSATALEDWGMAEMASRAARSMETVGNSQDGNAMTKTGGRVISGKYAFGSSAVAHYGFVQNRMPQWIRNARGIPGMVMPPIFTFLEQRSVDDTGRGALPIYGPKIAGSAKTSDVPSWVGNCLHVAREMNNKGDAMEHRIWTVNHIDAGGNAPHLAKTRAEPGSLPAFLADQEGEPPFTRFSLGYFFDQLEQVLNVGSRQDAIDFPDAPFFVPLPAGEDTVMSARNISSTAAVAGIASRPIAGAPTAVAKPPAPAVITGGAAKPAVPPAAAPAVATAPTVAAPKPVAPAAVAPVVVKPAVATPVKVAAPAAPTPPPQTSPVVAPVVPPSSPAAPVVAAPVVTPAAPAAAIRPPQPSAVRATAPPAATRPAGPPPPPGKPPSPAKS